MLRLPSIPEPYTAGLNALPRLSWAPASDRRGAVEEQLDELKIAAGPGLVPAISFAGRLAHLALPVQKVLTIDVAIAVGIALGLRRAVAKFVRQP